MACIYSGVIGKYCFIDKNGNRLFDREYLGASSFGDNRLAAVMTAPDETAKSQYNKRGDYKNKCEYINENGKVVIRLPEKYWYAGKFVRVSNTKE